MTRLYADQLPADVRKRLGIDQPKSRPSRAGVGLSVRCPGWCSCGDYFDTPAAWERHAKATGCSRWNLDLEAP